VHQAVDSRYAARVDRLMDNPMDRLRACPQVAHEPPHTWPQQLSVCTPKPRASERERERHQNGAHARPTHRHRTPQASYARDWCRVAV